ncbi:MAG: hypothetical protein JWL83_4058 [Actinomycetia bacterium]|jgi:hypothetical protein|nr:hypothetical protein [Actinomycetes bacterium]
MSRRAAKVLIAAGIWTLYVWVTRMWNIAHDSHGFAFKAVHGVLAVISCAFGIAVGVIGWRALRTRPATSAGSAGSAGHDGREAGALEERAQA